MGNFKKQQSHRYSKYTYFTNEGAKLHEALVILCKNLQNRSTTGNFINLVT